jgi:hypothetical protein
MVKILKATDLVSQTKKMYLNKTLSDKNLINCVKEYAQIYDNANAEFKNVQLKEDCWSSVANQLHLEGKPLTI